MSHLVGSLIFLFYKYVLMPLGYLLLQILRPLTRGKLREMIQDKNISFSVVKNIRIFDTSPIWIHAASGEIEYARSVIRELRTREPKIPILVTYSSPSAKRILKHLEVDAWAALPWDMNIFLRAFYRKWEPRALLVSRTDVWPGLASFAKQNKMPCYLFSATFANNSSRLKGLTRHLTAHSLNQLSAIFCVSDADASNLISLRLNTPVTVIGDTRFDQVFHRLAHAQKIRHELSPPGFSFIMGSTWPEDEAVLIPAMQKLAKEGVRFVLAPHEIDADHLRALEADLKAAGLNFFKYTQAIGNSDWDHAQVLLIDQVGILAELYTWGQVAFVGGSFKRQVHSVMEPLAAGLPVLIGPFHENNREALRYQRVRAGEWPLVLPVNSSQEIIWFVQNVRAQNESQLRVAVKAEIEKMGGATDLLLKSIESELAKTKI